jgi:hypothetical protein
MIRVVRIFFFSTKAVLEGTGSRLGRQQLKQPCSSNNQASFALGVMVSYPVFGDKVSKAASSSLIFSAFIYILFYFLEKNRFFPGMFLL